MIYPLLADPLDKGWTALQSWDPDQGRGALLAFRQDSPDETRRIALENVAAGASFDLVAAPSGELVDTVSSAQLRSGHRGDAAAAWRPRAADRAKAERVAERS